MLWVSQNGICAVVASHSRRDGYRWGEPIGQCDQVGCGDGDSEWPILRWCPHWFVPFAPGMQSDLDSVDLTDDHCGLLWEVVGRSQCRLALHGLLGDIGSGQAADLSNREPVEVGESDRAGVLPFGQRGVTLAIPDGDPIVDR